MQEKDYQNKIKELESRIKKLEQKNELYENILAKLPVGIQVFDEKGISYLINKTQVKLLGLPNLYEGIGKFNVLTDSFSIATGASKIYKKAYSGETYEHTIEYNLGLDENKWDTRKDKRLFNEKIIPIKNKNQKVEYVLAILEDITEKENADQALKLNASRLKEAQQIATIGYFEHSFIENTQWWSDETYNILGYKPAEKPPIYEVFIKGLLESDSKKLNELVNRAEKYGEDYSTIYEYITPNTKEHKYISVNAHVVFNDSKKPIGLKGTIQDITQQQYAEIKFKTVFEITEIGFTLSDSKGNVIDCNSASEKILGITKEEHLTRNFKTQKWAIVYPNGEVMPSHAYPGVIALKENKVISNVELGVTKPDGIVWLNVTAIPLNIKNYGVLVAYVDITERKKEEEKRVIFNRNFEAFLKQTSDYIFFKDNKSRFVFCSQTFANITNHKHWKDMIGKHDLEIFPKETAMLNYEEEIPIFKYGKPIINKINTYSNKNGGEMLIQTNKWPLFDKNENVVGIFGIGRDITEKLKSEEKIKQSEKILTELNATKDKLFSIIAHDLRSPFNALIGLNELVLEKINTDDPKAAKAILELIHKTSLQALNLLDNLLQWSRLQTGKMKFKPAPFDFKKTLDNVLALLEAGYSKKNIVINASIEPWLSLYADEFMIETILRNLISNAIKFTNQGGEINILALKIDDNIKIDIIDNGVGIPKNKINSLFTIQTNETTTGTDNEKGSGLGLVLCKEFIDIHNGKIWVESKENEWTKFSFTIRQ